MKHFDYQQIKYVFSMKKWSQDSLVSMMNREGLENPSTNLDWGRRYFIFNAQRPHRLWGLPRLLFIEHRSKGAGERSLQHIQVPSSRISWAILLPQFCFHFVGEGISLQFVPHKMSPILEFYWTLHSRFYFGLALRCHVLIFYTFNSRFLEIWTPVL